MSEQLIEAGFATKAIHAGHDPKQWEYRPIVPPLVMSTIFEQIGPGQKSVNIKLP